MDCIGEKLYHQGDEFELEGVVLRDPYGVNSSWEVKYRGGIYGACHKSSYLSQISRIISVEKKLSCGEILRTFGKFWRNLNKQCLSEA